jgi:hypothetical protein
LPKISSAAVKAACACGRIGAVAFQSRYTRSFMIFGALSRIGQLRIQSYRAKAFEKLAFRPRDGVKSAFRGHPASHASIGIDRAIAQKLEWF